MRLVKPNSISISFTITAIFLTLVVALLGTVVWTSYESSRSTTLNLTERLARESLSHVKDSLQNHLSPVIEQTRWTADLVSSQTSQTDDLAKVLVAAMAPTPQVTALVFISPDDQVTRAYRGSNGKGWYIDAEPPRDPGFASRTLERASQSKSGFWNEIVFSEPTQRSYVNYVMPVWNGDTFTGALLAAVSLNELSDLVNDIGGDMGGTLFILRNRDEVIAHPNLTSPHPDLSPDTPTVAIGRVGDLVLPRFWSARAIQVQSAVANDDFDVRRTDIAGESHIFISSEVTGFGKTPWIVGGHIDAHTVEAPFETIRHSLFIGVAIILLGAVLAVYLGHIIAQPIKVASGGIARIAELEISEVEPLPGSRISELDAQARAFNNMLEALRWFSLYVPRSLVNRLIRRGAQAVASEEREITVLFTDLAGFTSVSERLSAEQTADLLNHHFALLAACVEAESGTIDKFMGDALMAFWGAPDEQPDHAARAARAARAMVTSVRADNAERTKRGEAPVRFRVGLHCGPAVVGNIGAPERMNYTVVGDTVNTAQRMEQLGKKIAPDAETVILATRDIIAQLPDTIGADAVGALEAKGKAKPVDAFSL